MSLPMSKAGRNGAGMISHGAIGDFNHRQWAASGLETGRARVDLEKCQMNTVEERIEALEMRLAYQEKTIGELNDVITSQWKKIEALERQLKRFGEELEARESGDAPANEKPPQY
jgi:SlyX protein